MESGRFLFFERTWRRSSVMRTTTLPLPLNVPLRSATDGKRTCDAITQGMLLGTQTFVRSMARRALTALLAVVCLLMPLIPMAARQAADWTGGVTCGMECCKRTGHCCCHKPRQATPTSGAALAARTCPAGCGSSAQPAQSGSNLFPPAALSIAARAVPACALQGREAGSHQSSSHDPSLWQRPPPVSPC